MMVGQLRTPVPAASKKRLVGACDGATHYVHGATVGAFAMTQGTAAEAHAGVKLLVEVGSTQLSRKQTTRRDGNLQACRQATTNDAAPRPGCGALLRVDLTAFHDERGPGGAGTGGTTGMGGTAGTGGTTGIGGMGGAGGAGGTDDRRAKLPIELRRVCPKGFVLSGGKCTRRVRARLFRCEYGDTRTCVKQCRAGNTDSCVVLGVMHAHAYGAPKDAARAEELLGGACRPEDAQGGHLVACGELGVLEQGGHLGAPDPRRAERLLDKACQGGRSQSCLDLAVLRWYGPPEVRDQKRAAESFERGCRAGSLRSCTRLGMVLLVGGGVERDQPRSRALLKRTCDIGDDLGCAQVAMLLHYGLGGPADPAEAALMAQVACDAGEAAGCAYLGLAYDLGRGADEDKDRAYMLYHRACTLNRHLCTEFGFFQRMRGMGDHWRPYGKACPSARPACLRRRRSAGLPPAGDHRQRSAQLEPRLPPGIGGIGATPAGTTLRHGGSDYPSKARRSASPSCAVVYGFDKNALGRTLARCRIVAASS